MLENDGFEVDVTYFHTLDKNTCLMVLEKDEDRISPSEYEALQIKEAERKAAAQSLHEVRHRVYRTFIIIFS